MSLVPTTLNPDDKWSAIALTGDDLIATLTQSVNLWRGARSVFSTSTGKYYWEKEITSFPGGTIFQGQGSGIGTITATLSSPCGDNAQGWEYTCNGVGTPSLYHNGVDAPGAALPLIQGDYIGTALDLDNDSVWWCRIRAGVQVWLNGGDPSAGTGAQYSDVTGTIFAMEQLYTASISQIQVGTHNFGATAFQGTVPTGFNAGFGLIPTITATAGVNGSIHPSGTIVINEDDQFFDIVSAFGGQSSYAYIKDVLVDSVSVGRVLSYNFANVAANHTISATFLAWPDLEIIRIAIRDILREPAATRFTDDMLRTWINEAVRDIAIKTSCYESIVSGTTTPNSRLVPIAGYKVNAVEYLPDSGNRIGLQRTTPKSLGRLSLNGSTPQYWFQWGTDVVIEPKPTAAYSLNLYTSQWPDYLMSALDDEPLIDQDFHILILVYVLSKAYLQIQQFKTAAMCYQMYVAGLNQLKNIRVKRPKDRVMGIKLPDSVRRVKQKEARYGMAGFN